MNVSNSVSGDEGNSSMFRRIPHLATGFKKIKTSDGKVDIFCRHCDKNLKTRELARLIKHANTCDCVPEDYKKTLNDLRPLPTGAPTVVGSIDSQRDLMFTRVIVENNIPLRCVESSSFRKFINSICPSWKCDTIHNFAEKHIPILAEKVKKSFLKGLNDSKNPLSLEFDHWLDENRRSLLGIVVTKIDGSRYLCDLKDVSRIGNCTVVIVKEIQSMLAVLPTDTINSIVSASNSSGKKTREELMKLPEFAHIIQHNSVAHLLNRLGNHFTNNALVDDAMRWATKLESAISNNPKILARINQAGKCRVFRACSVRWYPNVEMLSWLLGMKDLIISEAEKNIDIILDDQNWKIIQRAKDILKPLAKCIATAERKAGSLGEATKDILEFGRQLFDLDWQDPYVLAAIASFLTFISPAKLGMDEFGLMLAAYSLDRRFKMDYISEDGIDLVLKAITRIALKSEISMTSCRFALVPEFETYLNCVDEFAASADDNESAVDWWSTKNVGALQKVALRIGHLHSSSANIERTFSALEFIHQGPTRMSLPLQTMANITRIRLNEDDGLDELLNFEHHDKSITAADNSCQAIASRVTIAQLIVDRSSQISNCSGVHLPNLLPEEARESYYSLMQFIDFSRVTPARESTPLTSTVDEEEIDEIVRYARASRDQVLDSNSLNHQLNC